MSFIHYDELVLLVRDLVLAEPDPEGVRHRAVSAARKRPQPRPEPSPEALHHLMASLSRKRPRR